ncbi:hypothetical protein AB0J48_34165 [Nocardia salmonicida]|uniref:hypothetical protein n=1 Tax=Nocardia salmonicida TaxID=53431 RepID=UPI003426D542
MRPIAAFWGLIVGALAVIVVLATQPRPADLNGWVFGHNGGLKHAETQQMLDQLESRAPVRTW